MTLAERLESLVADWREAAGDLSSPSQRTLSEAADDIAALLGGDECDATPCDSESWSWDHFAQGSVDGYWMRCSLAGGHDEHESSETGATWKREAGK